MSRRIEQVSLRFNGRVLRRVIPWALFLALWIWGWRIPNPFTHIPAYGDALEVIWGIEWYYRSLFVDRISPLFTNRVFHPNGWHTATLAHTPPLFLLAQPFRAIGGAAFAYNALVLLAQVIAFAGACRLLRLYTTRPVAWIAAAMLSFWNFRWFRIGGHLHVLWATALLPWLAWVLERWGKEPVKGLFGRAALLAGLVWGAMINFALYSLFLGGLVILIQGRDLWRKRILWRSAVLSLLVGSGTIIPYWIGAQQDTVIHFGISHVVYWGASLNSLAVPSVYHPIKWIREIARHFYLGPYDESGVANLGIITLLLFLIGFITILRRREVTRYANLFWLAVIGVLLSLGLLVRWNGEVVSTGMFKSVNAAIWRIGHLLKPSVFTDASPGGPFVSGIPLPGFLLSTVVPFWESARVASRYIFVAALGIIPLSAKGLDALPKKAHLAVAALWLLEFLPSPFIGKPLPSQGHPAYAYVAQHLRLSEESVVEVQYPTLRIGGDVLYASWMSGVPTAAGVGSFWPRHTMSLWRYFLTTPHVWSREETAAILRAYHVRYVLIYHLGEKEDALVEEMKRNPRFRFTGCFDPPPDPFPWPYPICVAEVEGPEEVSLLRTSGWSGEEPWGFWAEGETSEALLWLPHPIDVRLLIEAFPHCVAGRNQRLTVSVNGSRIAEHQWEDCNPWSGDLAIPSSFLRVGENKIEFRYAYAARPVDVTDGKNGDARWLSVGFSRLEIQEAPQ